MGLDWFLKIFSGTDVCKKVGASSFSTSCKIVRL